MNTAIFKQAQKLVADNSAALLTGTSVVGVVTTAVLTGRATLKAQQVIAHAEGHSYVTVENIDGERGQEIVKLNDVDSKDKIKMVWPLFIPAAASGVSTMAAIVMSYRIMTTRSAALAAAYGISEKAFAEYKEKVLQQVTPKKADEIRDAVDKEQLSKNPPPAASAFILGEGDVLCLDAFSGRYFRASVETIRKAENDVNAEIGLHNVCSLGDFYERVGMQQTDMSEAFCWNIHNMCEVEYTTQLTDDGRPCLVVNFVNAPRPTYDQGHKEYL